jgi:hypothetical protein
LGVEGPEWLIEQEHPRLNGEGSGESHALALTAGELGRVAIGQVTDSYQFQQLIYLFLDLGLGTLTDFESEGDVLAYREMTEGGVVLEAEPDPSLAHGDIGQILIVDLDDAGVGHFQAGDYPQQRGLSTTARSEQGSERALGDMQAYVVESNGISVTLGD